MLPGTGTGSTDGTFTVPVLPPRRPVRVGSLTRTAASTVLALVGALVLCALVPVLVGWRADVIVSGSMAPAVRAGDVVVTSPVDTREGKAMLLPGRVVLFPAPGAQSRSRPSTVVHRVAARDGDVLTTRGDANANPDSDPVAIDAVLGVARLRVPSIGLPALWLREGSWGPLSATAAALVVAMAVACRRPAP